MVEAGGTVFPDFLSSFYWMPLPLKINQRLFPQLLMMTCRHEYQRQLNIVISIFPSLLVFAAMIFC